MLFLLIAIPNINEFAEFFEQDEKDKKKLAKIMKEIYDGKPGLPKFIVDSLSEGLNQLVDKLIKTGFLN